MYGKASTENEDPQAVLGTDQGVMTQSSTRATGNQDGHGVQADHRADIGKCVNQDPGMEFKFSGPRPTGQRGPSPRSENGQGRSCLACQRLIRHPPGCENAGSAPIMPPMFLSSSRNAQEFGAADRRSRA